ncbi:MAG: PD-(D/E)XK nuclease family protein [Candidatus Coproplasma sp.]
MITAYVAPALPIALGKLKDLISENEGKGKRTVIFCEDRLTLAAERTVCAAVGGSFSTSVYTFARFLAAERGRSENVLSSQGSAMAIRKLIDGNRESLTLFKRLNSANAAQDVYDTIALLYSSRVTPEDLSCVVSENALLNNKLRDLEFLYRSYRDYLSENGCMDRNRYLSLLPEAIVNSKRIRGADVIFLGFQAFTCSVKECASACMDAAKNVFGLFIGGGEDVYTNEAVASFQSAAREFGGCNTVNIRSNLNPAAEKLRLNIFDPDSFNRADRLPCDCVAVFEGNDEEEEIEFIAASIIKHAFDEGVRYQSISVMLPDLEGYRCVVERTFNQYKIPYYLDRRYPLSEHFICSFLCGFLACAADGCTFESVSSVVSSPVFALKGRNDAEMRKDKDIFINYMLRLAAFRGGVKREPKQEILASLGFDFDAVQRVRGAFLQGMELFNSKGSGESYCAALRKALTIFDAEETLKNIAADFADEEPSLSALSARAYESALSVIDEAEKLTQGTRFSAREFLRVLKSGFAAMRISLIPPKQDAVFVGDLTSTANTGSEIIFAAGLTGDVPSASADTAILTDRELSSLENLNLIISPKISQVNRRARETVGLNLCAFRKRLYLCYPVRRGGEECGASEIIAYARALFKRPSGEALSPITMKAVVKSEKYLPYFCSRPAPALRRLVASDCRSGVNAAIYAVLNDNGYGEFADDALAPERERDKISCGKKLYGNVFSPTALESYFTCPYRSFMQRGLKLAEREEGVMRPLDCGNFIHEVLQKLAYTVNLINSEEELVQKAEEIAAGLLSTPEYAALSSSKRGEHMGKDLIEEAVKVSSGMYAQLKNSNFKVSAAESNCEMALDNGVKLFGRIDRVDSCDDMVRIIDYKTGSVDNSASSYYMGQKLQLPVYLLASSSGKRAVGAYYFPAKVEYEDEHDGVFRLKGYMDGSEEVVKNSDTLVSQKCKSSFVDAYLNGRAVESVLDKDDFADFLQYSRMVARKGAAEMTGGNVSPSPAEGACDYCSFAGSCGFAAGIDGEERAKIKVDCRRIAEVVREERGDK